jgi:dihydrodipicolinate synthase/N-acetylneuraminate lyase
MKTPEGVLPALVTPLNKEGGFLPAYALNL